MPRSSQRQPDEQRRSFPDLPPFEPGQQICPSCSATMEPWTYPHDTGRCLTCKERAAWGQRHVMRACTRCGAKWAELPALVNPD